MEDDNKDLCCKITLLGSCNVGKTAIINKLVNKFFPTAYEPTMDIENYFCRFNLNEEDMNQKTLVNLIIQDMFGLNNSLLQKAPELISSKVLKEKRDLMRKQYRDIMFTSNEKRSKLSKKEKAISNVNQKKKISREEIFADDPKCDQDATIERLGFIFVCDCENASKTFESVNSVMEKLEQIEKTNSLEYPKVILFNKCDKLANDKQLAEDLSKFQTRLESLKQKQQIDCLKVSALTGQGLVEAFKRFVSRIHQEKESQKENDGINDPDDDEKLRIYPTGCGDKWNSCSKSIFCGSRLFSCQGGRIPEEDEEEENK